MGSDSGARGFSPFVLRIGPSSWGRRSPGSSGKLRRDRPAVRRHTFRACVRSTLPCHPPPSIAVGRRARGRLGLRPGSRGNFPAAPRAVCPIRRHELDWFPALRRRSAAREFGGFGLCRSGTPKERLAHLFLDGSPFCRGPRLLSLLRSGGLGGR